MLSGLRAKFQTAVESLHETLSVNTEGKAKNDSLRNPAHANHAIIALAQQVTVSNSDLPAITRGAATPVDPQHRSQLLQQTFTQQNDDASLFWLRGGGYKNMPVSVPTDAQTSQSAVMKKAYEEFGKLSGLSDAGITEFTTERMTQQNGGQVFKRGEQTPYGDAEFAAEAATGGFSIYATEDDIAQLTAIKTRETNAAIGDAPLLAPPSPAMPLYGTPGLPLEKMDKTTFGAAAAYLEDQFMMTPDFYKSWGLPAPDETNQNAEGRAAGHTISAVQAAAEIAIGGGAVGGGTVFDLSGVGAIIGVPAQAIGAVMITHGTLTGANTIHNIVNDPILNKEANQTSGNQKTGGAAEPTPPQSTAPQGKLEIEPGRTLSATEQRIADKLVAEGKQVNVPKEVENQAGVRNPDFEVNGVKTELKTVSNIKKTDPDGLSGKLSQRISEATSQGSNVIIDAVEQTGMTKDVAELGIKRAFGRWKQLDSDKVTNVRIIGKDFDINQTFNK